MRYTRTIAVVGLLLVSATTAFAQGPPPGMGGFQPSPEMRKKFEAWQNWRKSHKNINAVQQTLRGIEELQQDPSTRLTKPQAAKVVSILRKWRNKPIMTDEQARGVNRDITASLSLVQIKKLAAIAAERGGRGGFGGGGGRPGGGFGGGGGRPGGGFGGGRPGGAPGGPGGPGGFQMPEPKDYNPLNPDTLPFERMRGRSKERLNALTSELAKTK